MNSSQIVGLLLAALVGGVSSIVAGVFSRPKVNAEARAASATGEVAISGSALSWAESFQRQAQRADERANAAEAKADEAEKRCDGMERQISSLTDENARLRHRVSHLEEELERLRHDQPRP